MLSFTVDGKTFADALSRVSRSADHRSYVRCLSFVHVTAHDNDIVTLTATDMESRVTVTVAADVKIAGSCVAGPVKTLAATVKTYAGTVDVATATVDGSDVETLSVTCGGSGCSFETLPAEDYPLDGPLGDHVASLELETFLGCYRPIAHAVSRDDSRPVLTGVCVTFTGDRLTMAATDSYRLAVQTVNCSSLPADGFIVPGRAIALLEKISKQKKGAAVPMLAVYRHESRVTFTVGPLLVLTSREIQGQFPDCDRLRPDITGAGAWCPDVDVTVAAIGRLEKSTDSKNHPVRVTFGDYGTGSTTLELDSSAERVPATYSGEPMVCGYNAGFLADAIGSLGAGAVTASVINPLRPMYVQNGNPESWRLLMPIRLAG